MLTKLRRSSNFLQTEKDAPHYLGRRTSISSKVLQEAFFTSTKILNYRLFTEISNQAIFYQTIISVLRFRILAWQGFSETMRKNREQKELLEHSKLEACQQSYTNLQLLACDKHYASCSGYMSPEYAIDGKFSFKSDVFSYGVVLLETVSGKKNRSFNHSDHHHNLLGHVRTMVLQYFFFSKVLFWLRCKNINCFRRGCCGMKKKHWI